MAWYRCGGTPSNILALPTPSEASGAIARFNTDLTENLLSAVAEFSASQASGTPTPSAPIPIVGVDKVNFTLCGKNLFNFDTVTAYNANVTVTKSNGDITVQNSNGYTLNALNGSEVYLKSGTYAISISEATTAAINIYKGGSWIASGISVGNTSGTFTITNSDTYNLTANVAGNSTITIKKLQIEKGSTATEYEPYNGTTALINLGGTYYGGSVDAVTGKITEKMSNLLDLGSISWSYNTTYQVFLSERVLTKKAGFQNLLCDSYKVRTSTTGGNWNLQDKEIGGGSNSDYIYIKDTDYTDATAFRNSLSGKYITYELATPIVVYASNTAEIPTIVGDNQVFADTGDVAVKYFETVGHKI